MRVFEYLIINKFQVTFKKSIINHFHPILMTYSGTGSINPPSLFAKKKSIMGIYDLTEVIYTRDQSKLTR